MVAAPCLASVNAARWNGHAPHTATGEASTSEAHCQFRNCAAGTIASTTTGTASASDTSSRCRSAACSSRASSGGVASGPAIPGSAGGGSEAVYPACSTVRTRSSGLTAAGKLTRAVSVAKLTVAVTPSSLLSFFSTRAAHDAHVIPPIDSSTLRPGPSGVTTCLSPASVPIGFVLPPACGPRPAAGGHQPGYFAARR